MTRQRAQQWLLVGLAIAVPITGCDDAVVPAATGFGKIEVTAFTTGPDSDVDGYTVFVDDRSAGTIATNGSRTVDDVTAGSHVVKFGGVATNCTMDAASKTVTVTASQATLAVLTITCVARNPAPMPPLGTLQIITLTSGPEQDEDGYTAYISNFNAEKRLVLPTSGTVSVDLAVGNSYFIALGDIAPNCRIPTNVSPEQTAKIVAGTVVSVSFAITCERAFPARLPSGSQLAFVRNGQIHLVNSDGTGMVRLTEGPNDCDPSWSPDGQRLAFVRGCHEMASAIYLMNADGSNLERRTQGVSMRSPSWSPDGSRIAFAKHIAGSTGVVTMSASDDGIQPVVLLDRPGYDAEPAWSPDGKRIAFVSDWAAYDFVYDIYVTSTAGGTISQLTTGFNYWPNLLQYYEPAWSPDGARLAVTRCPAAFYTCDVSDVVVMEADGSGLTAVAATRGYTSPTWSADGTVIAFSSGGMIGWVRLQTKERGFIVDQGQSPAWRPLPPTASVRPR